MYHSAQQPASIGASLFGKLPSNLDFIRVAHHYPESVGLERWLHSGYQRLVSRGCQWPSKPVRFVFAPERPQDHALFGVIAGSRGRAGREFPVVVYARCAYGTLRCGSSVLAAVGQVFCRQVERMLAEYGEERSDLLLRELQGLRPPAASALRSQDARITRLLQSRSLGDFAQSLFPGLGSQAALAGCHALRRMCSGRAANGGQPVDAFECPVQELGDGVIWTRWLEMSHSRHASCLWQVAPGGARWLLTPGVLTERVWVYWALPRGTYPQRAILRAEHGHGSRNAVPESASATLQRVFQELLQERRGGLTA